MDKLLLELEELGFPMLAEWIYEGEIDFSGSLKHLEENKDMMEDEEDRKAFEKADKIVRTIFQKE